MAPVGQHVHNGLLREVQANPYGCTLGPIPHNIQPGACDACRR